MNAVIYARFSSSGQREESIEGQVRECTAYAEKKGYTVVETYADRALSGTNDKRPEFQRMIHDSTKNKFEVLICWKHDRFARNRYDSALYKAKLKNNGVKIEYAAEPLSDGAEAIILDSVLEGYAEYYSANLSQNVKRGLYDSALKRLTLGQYCYGLTKAPDGTFMHHPVQAPIVKRIFEEYASGRSAADIIKDLNNEGYRTYTGAKFNKNSVANIVGNPKYKGVYQYGDIYDEEGIPPIVSKELWDKANQVKNKRRQAPRAKSDYLLTGKLFCGHCGKSMVAGGGRSHTGKYYQYYQCRTKDKNPVPKDYIEEVVISRLVEVIQSDEFIENFADKFMAWQTLNNKNSELEALRKRVAEIDKSLKNIFDAIAKGLPSAPFIEQTKSLQEEKEQLADSIARLEFEEPVIERDMIVWFLERFRSGDVDDLEWKKYLIKNFLQAVYLFDDGHLIIQLDYTGECNTISLDLLNELDGSILAPSSPPDCANSNFIFVLGYLLLRS